MAKQTQVEVWATEFAKQDDHLYETLLGFCLVLCDKPSLPKVHADLDYGNYRPKPVFKNQIRMADDMGPYPHQDVFHGEVLNGPLQRTEEELEL